MKELRDLRITSLSGEREREFCIDNLLVRIHYIIEMIKWTGLAPCEFEFPFPGSLISTFQGSQEKLSSLSSHIEGCSRPDALRVSVYRGTSLIRNRPTLAPHSRFMSRALWWS